MRFTAVAIVALAGSAAANSWLGSANNAAYNKWHETELERWLSDHNVPYPTPSDRKDLQDLVKNNWDDNVVKPYNKWDTNHMANYLTSQGYEIKKGTEKNKDSLLSQVSSYWKGTEETANSAYHTVQNWIFDSWTESQLKSFLDHHNIPNPSPRTRDSLLSTVRNNYASAAGRIGETTLYPGNWIYHSWSESDLKAWLDERGIPVPQPSSRDKLIASVRRNAKIAADSAASSLASASSSAKAASESLSNALIDSWSDSEIKAWADKQGIRVPQGSKRNELIALARKHSAQLSGNNAASSASGYFHAATTSAGNTFAQATNDAYGQFRGYYDWALNNIGMASEEAKSSLSSAAIVASSSASSASSVASVSASSAGSVASRSATSLSSSLSSASSVASKSASSLSSAASKSASSASKEASKSGLDGASAASSAAKKATAEAKASSASAKAEL